MRGISVIIPAFNEGHHIRRNLLLTAETMVQSGVTFEVILVDDGSTDNTSAEATEATRQHPAIRLISYAKNAGKGFAFKKGCGLSKYSEIALLDADLDYHPDHVLRLHQFLEQTGADIVIGSKHHPESVIHYPPLRLFLSKVFAFAVKILFCLPVRDTQSGIKLFKRSALAGILQNSFSTGFAFDLELLATANTQGLIIRECPVQLKFHHGKHPLPLSMMTRLFRETIRIWLRHRFSRTR